MSNDPEFKYIEDPEIAVLLREIGARWPEIAAGADHPLTEYFIHKHGRPGFIGPLLRVLRWMVLSMLLMLLYMMGPLLDAIERIPFQLPWIHLPWVAGLEKYLILFLVLCLLISMLTWKPGKVRAMASPEKLISKDPEQNCWIWLSGLRFSNFVAIHVAYNYWLAWGLRRWRSRLIILYLIAVGAIMAGMHTRFFSQAGVVFLLETVPFGIALIRLITEPVSMVKAVLQQIARLTGNEDQSLLEVMMVIMIAACLIMSNYSSRSFTSLNLMILLIGTGVIELCRLAYVRHISNLLAKMRQNEAKFIKLLAPEYNSDK